MTEFGFRLREPTGTAWSDAAMTLAAYLPLVGRSGVALLCRATASLLERESATLGWGAFARERGGDTAMEMSHPAPTPPLASSALPIKGRDGVYCTAQAR